MATDRIEAAITIEFTPRSTGYEAVALFKNARGTVLHGMRCGRGASRRLALTDLAKSGGANPVINSRLLELVAVVDCTGFEQRFGLPREAIADLSRDELRELMLKVGVVGTAETRKTVSKAALLALLDAECKASEQSN